MSSSPVANNYRPDIDGLRAIAVLAVIFFHAHLGGFSGGYVGVDVFFVISGYLITSLISNEMRQGRFSIVRFYERRARRIFPALFTVIIVSLFVGLAVLLPYDFKELGQSAVAAAAFVSNILFWEQQGYFATASEQKPLLHTWSLAVEEQFYIGYPVFLLLISRFLRARWIPWVAGVTAISFALSVWATYNKPTAAFFLAPPRAWELSIGCLLALGAIPKARSNFVRESMSIAGLMMILCSIHLYSRATPFPGVGALLPGIGTALIIHAGENSKPLINRMLSARGVVFVGLISYSLYLWHWPALVLAKHYLFRELTEAEAIVAIAASVALAILSWRFVERPFRQKSAPIGRREIFSWSAAAMVVIIAAGSYTALHDGLPGRFPGFVDGRVEPANFDRAGRCFLMPGQEQAEWRGGECFLPEHDGPINMLVWGDSYAASILPGLTLNRDRLPFRVLEYTKAGCHPVLGYELMNEHAGRCKIFNENIFGVIKEYDVSVVLIVGNWFTAVNHGLDIRDVRETLEELARRHVTVVMVGPSPNFYRSVPHMLLRSGDIDRARPRGEMQLGSIFAKELSGVVSVYLDPYRFWCDSNACRIRDENGLYFRDNGHVTPHGGNLLIREILSDLGKIADPRS